MVRLCTPLVLSCLVACASQTRLAEPIRAAVAAAHAGRTVELRQSCYYGDLYDENEKWLLSPHPFAETYHIVDLDGEPIHPKGQRGIVPAGTRFSVGRIEFPDHYAVAMRMLTTPRYNPWIYLTPAGDANLPMDRKAYILLLPMDMDTREQVEAAIDELLAPVGEVRAWLADRRPSIQVAIKHKDVAAGMSEAELVAALGRPHRWFNDSHEKKPARVAWYPSREAWLVGGKVVTIAEARAVRAPRGEATTTGPAGDGKPPAPTDPGAPPPAATAAPSPTSDPGDGARR